MRKKARLQRNGQISKSSDHFKLPKLLLPALILLGALSIYFAIETATSGSILTRLEQEEYALSRQNQELSSQIIEASSLIKLDQKANELGFVKPNHVLYISGKESVAQLPQ